MKINIYIMVLLLEELKFDCECYKRFKGTPADSIMNCLFENGLFCI